MNRKSPSSKTAMSNETIFYMWRQFKSSLIDGHLFYVEQARKRLLSQFSNIENEAELAEKEWLEEHRTRFTPDTYDPSDFYEAANSAGINHYELLSEMRDRTRLSVVAGIYHEWDKQLHEWLVKELRRIFRDKTVLDRVWKADFNQIVQLLDGCKWKTSSQPFFQKLDACRVVVNVYKHGEGASFNELKQKYPEYLRGPGCGPNQSNYVFVSSDYSDLKVTDEQLEEFSQAIVQFWNHVPEHTFDDKIDLPDWLLKAIEKTNKLKAQP
jgi:hypothetical protein